MPNYIPENVDDGTTKLVTDLYNIAKAPSDIKEISDWLRWWKGNNPAVTNSLEEIAKVANKSGLMKIGGKLIPGVNVATAIYSSQKSFSEANEALNQGDTLGASLKYMNGITGLMGAIPGPAGAAIGIGGDVVFGGLDTLKTFIEEQNKTGQKK